AGSRGIGRRGGPDDAGRPAGAAVDATPGRDAERLRGDVARSADERDRLLRSVIANSMTLIYVKDLDGRYLLYNPRFAQATGLAGRAAAEGVSVEEVLIGRDDFWLHPEVAPVLREHDLRARDGPIEVTEFTDHPERGRLTYDSIKFPLLDDDGAAYATCGISLETTERTAEREQLAVAARYFDLSRDLAVASSFDGYFKSVNPALEHVLGWTPEEFLARPFLDMVHPDDRASTLREVSRLDDGAVTLNFVNRYEAKDGTYRWLDWNAIVPPGEALMYASARDVTAKKEVEAALEASERQTRLILETAQDSFVSFDASGSVTDWNRRAQASFGWTRDEMLGRDVFATLIPETDRGRLRASIDRFLATGDEGGIGRWVESRGLRRDGGEFPLEMTISPLDGPEGFAFNVFARDITERRGVEQELALAHDRALEASRMKSMFVANVSHEIRTPMNGVIGMTDLLLETDLDEEQREYAQTIASSGEALLGVIDDILDFSKIEAGKLELDPTEFELCDTIERAVGMPGVRAHEKGLELVVAIDPDLPASVRGDAARLRQVIANFVSNAIKFTASGEVVVRARSRPSPEGGVGLRVEVSDTGIGIGAEALERLFRPFAQADGSTTRKFGGTGLGLVISRQLIELMGGTVGAESEPGRGSTFWFDLTLERVAGGDRPSPEEAGLSGLRALVVHAGAASRDALAEQLEHWQMRCQVAASAGEALDRLESASTAGDAYALALIDVGVPDGGGYELAVSIRSRPWLGDTRLVLMTPSGRRHDAARDAALDGILSRPGRRSRLYEELRAVRAAGSRDAPGQRPRPAPAPGAEARDRGPGPRILVVEDIQVNQAVALHMLAKCGYRGEVAANGLEALEALSSRSFAAILMDCQMPVLDGFETTQAIREREPGGRRVPIIAMTANTMEGERARCLAAGMDDYLTKPLRDRILKDALARWAPDRPAGATTGADDDSATIGSMEASAGRDAPELLDEAVIRELGFEAEDLADLLAMYFDQAARQLLDLRGAVGRGEAGEVRETAHSLKGSSATLGAVRVAHLAAELETLARAGDLTGADALLATLADVFEQT
ncbi:MAG: two-component system, sensor histidine kinase and response regulator, partial [Solirubrobacteraceae bacterium]|nr:two-component system, sensor histidine kinase and response regulator [Solirubrobacteraceae bacterium]